MLADCAGEAWEGAGEGDEAALDFGEGEGCEGGGEDEVGVDGDFAAAAVGEAVDCGDDLWEVGSMV